MSWLDDTFGLAGRTALVTGARTGIGRGCALALADAGADLVLWARRPGDLEEVADEVRARGRTARVVGADLSDPSSAEAAAAEVLAAGRVDVLVNNAGTISRADAVDTTFEDWRAVLSTNLDSAFVLAQAFGRPMVERGSGAIINIASLLSFQGGIRVPAYAASKHAVAGLTKALANEWAASGVRVNAVAPGYVSTHNTDALRADPEREPAIRARIPAGRWADVQDIVGAVVFLASPAAAYVNGHVLVVDGGWLGR